jgi:hypothetical protein
MITSYYYYKILIVIAIIVICNISVFISILINFIKVDKRINNLIENVDYIIGEQNYEKNIKIIEERKKRRLIGDKESDIIKDLPLTFGGWTR